METVLVTGGAGFIGSHLVRHLLETGRYRVVNLDKLTYAGNLENLRDLDAHPLHRFVRGDVADPAGAEPLVAEAEAVIHLAAETHVDRSIGGPEAFLRTDVMGTYVLLEAARRAPKLRRFVHVSTDEVYGEAPPAGNGGRSREGDALRPKSPYAASKAGGDCLAQAYAATYGLPVVIARPCNTFGPRQHPEKMVALFITNALDGKPLPVYGDGENRREWLPVEELCRGLRLLLEASGVEGEVFNVSGLAEKSTLEMARSILSCLGLPEGLIRLVRDRPGHVRRHAVDGGKIRARLGFAPAPPGGFEGALEATVRWYRENRRWWERARGGEFEGYYREMYADRLG